MGEPEAIKAIKEGFIEIDNKIFLIEKEPHGWCDGCYFLDSKYCPTMARKICCTGGMILKEK